MLFRRTLFLLILLLAAVSMQAQSNASLRGVVTDVTGAGIPNAIVTVTETSTGLVHRATSSSNAEYQILYLPVGQYVLQCEAAGFGRFQQRLTLDVGESGYLAVKLLAGNVNSTVTVTAEQPLLEATTADRGLVIDPKLVTEIPVSGHSAIMQASIVPGVIYAGGASQRPFDNGGTANWVINGGSSNHNEFFMDGAPDNAYITYNFAAYMPSPDVVQESKIITTVYDAQYGKSGGGIISFTTKSGANDFHGTVYEYMQRTGWQANSFANNYAGHPRGQSTIDQFGGVVSGPIWLPKIYDGRNRSFFLFNYDGYRSSIPRAVTASVPAPEFLTGDFSSYRDGAGNLIPIYDYTNVVNGVRQPFPGNRIPANRLDPVAQSILSYYTKPNFTTQGANYSSGNFYDSATEQNPYSSYLYRFDHSLSSTNRLFFRHVNSAYQQHTANGSNGTYNAPGENVQYLNRNNKFDTLNWNWAFSPRWVSDLTLSYNRYEEFYTLPPNYSFNPTQLGFSANALSQLPIQNFFGTFSLSGYSGLGGTTSSRYTNSIAVLPQFSTVYKTHTFKFGADLRDIRYSVFSSNSWGLSASGNLTANNAASPNGRSGNALASFLLGGATSSATYNPRPYYVTPYAAFYFQDAWRITQKMTINLGLRNDIFLGPTEIHNRANNGFNTTAKNPAAALLSPNAFPGASTLQGGLQFAGVNGVSDHLFPTSGWNFQPRIGVAYQITPKLVGRAGWGRMYVTPDYNSMTYNLGYTQSTSYSASSDSFTTISPGFIENPYPNGVLQAPGSANGYATYLGQGFSYVSSSFKPAHEDQYSVGFQYLLPLSSVLDVSYVGTNSKNLTSAYSSNEVSLSVRRQCDFAEGGNPTYCSTNVPNPFRGLAPFAGSTFYTSATTTNYQLSRPFPEFGALTEAARHDGAMWYNSGQVLWRAQLQHHLTSNINYTFAKQMMLGYNANYLTSAGDFLDTQQMKLNRSVYEGDQTHRFSAALVYQVPMGRGQSMLGNVGPWLNRLVSGYQISPWLQWNSGVPWALPNAIPTGDYHIPAPNWNAPVIVGMKHCVAQYATTPGANFGAITLTPASQSAGCTSPDWIAAPQYAPRFLPYLDSRIRLHTTPLLNVAISKTTPIAGRVSLQLRGEAYNATNTQNSSGLSFDSTLTDSTFGQIVRSSGAVAARTIQLTGKVIW